jgi:hypothetical protein
MANRACVIAAVALALALPVVLAGCSKVDRGHYDQVQTGMTLEQVKKIMGDPDETRSGGVDVLGIGATATTLTWKSGDKSITVTFVNDKVVAKDMSNL